MIPDLDGIHIKYRQADYGELDAEAGVQKSPTGPVCRTDGPWRNWERVSGDSVV